MNIKRRKSPPLHPKDPPFVPAWDLYEAQQNELTEDEIIVVLLALHVVVEDSTRSLSCGSEWLSAARSEAVERAGL